MLAERGLGADMGYAVREAAVGCLTVLGDETTSRWHDLLAESIAARRWRDADRAASISPKSVDDSMRQAAIDGVRSGQVRALDASSVLNTSQEGAELFKKEVAEVAAAREPSPDEVAQAVAAAPPPARRTRKIIRLEAVDVDFDGPLSGANMGLPTMGNPDCVF